MREARGSWPHAKYFATPSYATYSCVSLITHEHCSLILRSILNSFVTITLSNGLCMCGLGKYELGIVTHIKPTPIPKIIALGYFETSLWHASHPNPYAIIIFMN